MLRRVICKSAQLVNIYGPKKQDLVKTQIYRTRSSSVSILDKPHLLLILCSKIYTAFALSRMRPRYVLTECNRSFRIFHHRGVTLPPKACFCE
jgi:hypothetical protein